MPEPVGAAVTRFLDRRDAGRALGAALRARFGGRGDVVVLALPRGGVPVAYEVAVALGAPLDVLLVRRVRLPGDDDHAAAVVARGDVTITDAARIASLGIAPDALTTAIAAERERLAHMAHAYGVHEDADPRGRTVLLVDDGLFSGGTARAAAAAVRARGPARVVLAVPVASPACAAVEGIDEIVALRRPTAFGAVGDWYEDFSQSTDAEVRHLLAQARSGAAPEMARDEVVAPDDGDTSEITIPLAKGEVLRGTLGVPEAARALVLFAHGSGSTRQSVRNVRVAGALRAAGIATLLVDLLTEAEQAVDAETREHRFDVLRLADRLVATIDWIAATSRLAPLPLGLFGASTGGAAALAAAALRRTRVRAVVSRGGRTDLAAAALPHVAAPTLFIAGEWDEAAREADAVGRERLGGPSAVAIVPCATHLFGEPGALEEVARLACAWFEARLLAK